MFPALNGLAIPWLYYDLENTTFLDSAILKVSNLPTFKPIHTRFMIVFSTGTSFRYS